MIQSLPFTLTASNVSITTIFYRPCCATNGILSNAHCHTIQVDFSSHAHHHYNTDSAMHLGNLLPFDKRLCYASGCTAISHSTSYVAGCAVHPVSFQSNTTRPTIHILWDTSVVGEAMPTAMQHGFCCASSWLLCNVHYNPIPKCCTPQLRINLATSKKQPNPPDLVLTNSNTDSHFQYKRQIQPSLGAIPVLLNNIAKFGLIQPIRLKRQIPFIPTPSV